MPALISNRTIAQLRKLNESALPSVATVYATDYDLRAGTAVPSRVIPRIAGIPCRVVIPGLAPTEVLTAEQLRSAVRFRVDFAVGVTIYAGDRMIVTVIGADGRPLPPIVLDVQSAAAPQSYAVLLETLCTLAPGTTGTGDTTPIVPSDGDEIARTAP